eukprot:115310-Chlamydomonas_euryale.AAC.2
MRVVVLARRECLAPTPRDRSEASKRAHLQIRDNGVVHVLLLLAQKVRRHAVQRVARKLVLALDGSEQVKLHAPVDRQVLVFVSAVSLRRERGLAHAHAAAAHAAPLMELALNLECLGAP